MPLYLFLRGSWRVGSSGLLEHIDARPAMSARDYGASSRRTRASSMAARAAIAHMSPLRGILFLRAD
jgi:hypothetical protein